jgi:Phosphotransferase enzyme family
MNATDAAALLPPLLKSAGLDPDPGRASIRVWARSGVERLRLAGGGTVVFKYAEAPFDREHIALQLAAGAGLPVAALLAAHTAPGLLGMLLEDIGEPVREASDQDAATAAVAMHQVPVTAARSLPRLDAGALARLPARIATRAEWLDLPGGIAAAATAIGRCAGRLAEGAELPPFGFCHSEYHPTSLHVTRDGWRLLDLARAFTGPGLLDLASWHGTVTAPRPEATASLISAYIAAGGPPEAAAPRGGIPAHIWALAWHRVWIADWYAEQIERGWAGSEMHTWTDAITRHLHEATILLDS